MQPEHARLEDDRRSRRVTTACVIERPSAQGNIGPNSSRHAFSASPIAPLPHHVMAGRFEALACLERAAALRDARRVHGGADRRAQTRRVGPGLADAVGHGREEGLHLTVELAAPAAV